MKRKMAVYIVDDDPAIVRVLKELAEVMGFSAEGYESAEAFLDGYRPDRPGCLILDMSLPGMNGLELQTELKKRALALPVIFITGHGGEQIRTQAMGHGAVAVLDKPCGFRQLSEAIQKAVGSVGQI
jgi:two-component system, LuxR family, response regulator FixJ